MNLRLRLLAGSVGLLLPASAPAALVAGYSFGTFANPTLEATTEDPNINAGLVSYGPGLTGTGFALGKSDFGAGATGWTDSPNFASASTDYFQVTLAPDAGHSLNLDSVGFHIRLSSFDGPRSWALTSSQDNHATPLGRLFAWQTGRQGDYSFPLGAAFDDVTSPVTFRLHGFEARFSNQSGTLDDLFFDGGLTAVPEPHEYAAFAGLGLLGFAVWRRTSARRAR
ncbi:MAG: hypothetical protein ACKVYV_15680 [Limisphaerales bacterium]